MEFDIIKYALELVIRRHDIDDDVRQSAKNALKDQCYLMNKIDKLRDLIAKKDEAFEDLARRDARTAFPNPELQKICFEALSLKEDE